MSSCLEIGQQKIDKLGLQISVIDSFSPSSALFTHRQITLQCLAEFKRKANTVLNELQMIRVRQTLASKPALYHRNSNGSFDNEIENLVAEDMRVEAKNETNMKDIKDIKWTNAKNSTIKQTIGFHMTHDIDSDSDDDSSEGLMQKLVQEQSLLSTHLQQEMKEARTAEKQMHEFSELMEILSQKLSEQHDSILDLETDIDTSTKSLRNAEEHLVKAKSHNKSFRVYIIAFFAVIILSLLIMDRMD